MRTVGAFEAKTHLARLLDDVSRGDTITITRHGSPIAILAPAKEAPERATRDVIADIKAFRRDKSLGTVPVRELIDEGRRL